MQLTKIIAVSILVFSSISSNAQKIDRCALIDSILSIDKIGKHLQLEKKKARFIRIYNPSRFFKKCSCSFNTHTITFIDKLPLDFNSGRHIDMTITKIKGKRKNLNISIFYALSGQSDDYPNLWQGDIEFGINNGKITMINYEIYNIQ